MRRHVEPSARIVAGKKVPRIHPLGGEAAAERKRAAQESEGTSQRRYNCKGHTRRRLAQQSL